MKNLNHKNCRIAASHKERVIRGLLKTKNPEFFEFAASVGAKIIVQPTLQRLRVYVPKGASIDFTWGDDLALRSMSRDESDRKYLNFERPKLS